MARDLFGIELGVDVHEENGDSLFSVIGGTAVPDGTSGKQASVSIGSLYVRSGTGELYQKIANAGAPADYELNESGSTPVATLWRPELLGVVTNSAFAAGVRDMVASPFSDDDDGLVSGDFVVGEYVIGDADGTPALFEITVNAWPNITYVAAGAMSEGYTYVAKKYLPDPSGGENNAIVTMTSTVLIKMADIDFQFLTGINLSSGYALPANAVPLAGDTGEDAIGKLDANQRDLTTLSGEAIGSVNHGTFTGTTIPSGTTTHGALQSLETAHESLAGDVTEIDGNVDDLITLSGVPENSTDLGTFTGDIIPDSSNNKEALQSLETAVTANQPKYFSGTVAQNTPTNVDTVLADDFQAVKWMVTARDTANPEDVRSLEVFAMHDGNSSADATSTDDNVVKLNIGIFNLKVNTGVSGAGVAQIMYLELDTTEAGGITYTVERMHSLALAG